MEMLECSLAATLAPRPLPGRVRKAPPRPVVLAGRARLRVRSARREQPPPPPLQPVPVRASGTGHGGRALGQAAAGLAAAAVVSLTGFASDVSPLPTPPARAESLTVAFPVAKAREVNRVQRTLVEAWGLIRETFVDPTFNHQDWDQKLQQTMVEMFPLKSADAAYSKISGMLSTLGDPFTRIISPKEYQSFRIGSDGNVQGVGVFINREPSSGRLLVIDCIQGGPADRAGIHEGDELVEIDGILLFYTGTDNDRGGMIRQKEVQLSREIINLSPLSTTIISHRSDDGHECKTGYVRLAAFSQTAAAEMENAVKRMEDEGVQSYILDLRNNPGGLVKAGLDVAQIWLDGDETLVNTIDRDGNVLPINMIQGHSLTHDPLVVLVSFPFNAPWTVSFLSMKEVQVQVKSWQGHYMTMGELFWSAAERLVKEKFRQANLHNTLMSVTELDDGSALFITVAKYLSPALHEIDQVGIQPDIQCSPDILSLPRAPSLKENSKATSLEMDSCIMVAEQALEIEQTKGSAS
ncbi:Carboxyl-terminal-processing peptidase 3, chloroplastic [Dichanthelium oligosanthes]|uniref:C-terminal processing peptidase n=1 Tax=Dichanthelium oligosanthes TaxID=888268 RepID=A0A1E5UYP1_9POAL|nr:Carboxyl-terminal-processing peptidase 3, chloroplastic [Dichanthelium oligosanthes]